MKFQPAQPVPIIVRSPSAARPPAPPMHLALYRRIATVFLMLTAGTVGLVLYVIFSRATVVILARPEEVKLDSVIAVARDPIEGEVVGNVIEATGEDSQKFPSTSVVKVEAPAEGRVRLRSALGRPQTLVATTRLLTPDEKLYRLKQTIVVPAEGWIEADVYADKVGSDGEIGLTTFTIPGLLPENRKFFTVESVTPMVGGVKDVRLVTQSDVAAAVEAVKGKLVGELTGQLRQQAIAAGAKTSGEIISTEVLNQTTDLAVGTEAPEFTLTLKLQAAGVFYDRDQMGQVIADKLKGLVPFDRRFQKTEDQATTFAVEKLDAVKGRADVRVAAKGLAVLAPDAPSLDPVKLAGVTAEAAKSYLEKLDGVASASVKISPFWSGRLPDIPEHIKIEIR